MAEKENAGGNILIVDDTPVNINVLFDTLEQKGYKVLVAGSGESALERARYGKPDLILLDIMMPGIDGYETCRKLKEDEQTKNIPVIFMTALSETVDKLKGFELGAVDYITKPFQAEEVLARVDTHLTLRNLQKELQEANQYLEQRVAERTKELKAAKEKAEKSDRLKSEFLAQVSHEIRTPINAILSFSSLIEMQLEDEPSEDILNSLEVIEKGGRRLVRTFDLIIGMSQVQSGTYEFNPKEFDFYDMVLDDLSLTYKMEAKEKGLEFKVNKETDDAVIKTDLQMVKQIVDSILENAVDYTPEGFITVTVKRDENNKLNFIAADTGLGISDEYLLEIFEPFTQEEQGYSRRFEGNGLGLSLAKRYSDIINAEIKIESEKDKGSVFTVVFND